MSNSSNKPASRSAKLIETVDEALDGKDGISLLLASTEKRWRIPRTKEYLAMDFPPVEYFIGDWYAVGASMLICGAPKCGKTFFVYSLAHAVSIGAPIFGWQTPAGGVPVAIVDGEMRPQSIKRRLVSITKHIPGTGDLRILTREFFTDQGECFPDLSNPRDINTLLERISPKDDPVKVVVFDNINALFRGDENLPAYWNQVEYLSMACRERKIDAWLVHHTPKSNPGRPSGSSKAERIPDITIVLEKIGTAAGQQAHFNVKFLHLRDQAGESVNFSAMLDDATGWCVGDYVQQEILVGSSSPALGRAQAHSLLASGQSVEDVMEQTGLSRATVFRIKKELSK